METKQHWQDKFTLVVTLVIGAWLFITPFVYGFTHTNISAAWNSYVFGIVVMGLSLYGLATKKVWEDWLNLIIGVWLFFSSFALGFYDDYTLRLVFMNTGAVLFLFSLWSAMFSQLKISAHFDQEGHGHKA